MKVKLPKSIFVVGRSVSVSLKCCGNYRAHFNIATDSIVCECTNQDQAYQLLIHEIVEMILSEMRFRYHKSANCEHSDLLFVFNHEGLEQFVFQLHSSLRPFLNFGKE
jgi:hypothetical protein